MIYNYKSGMSTIQCASVVTETINYYLHNKSDIYMCTIDASKAFDRINLFVLFNLLRKRNFLFRCIWFTIMAFFNNSVKLYYTAWRKVIRKAWCLPFTTHCRFLNTINNSLPIDVQLEKKMFEIFALLSKQLQ